MYDHLYVVLFERYGFDHLYVSLQEIGGYTDPEIFGPKKSRRMFSFFYQPNDVLSVIFLWTTTDE